jgi:TusA-related sulfurtransferase
LTIRVLIRIMVTVIDPDAEWDAGDMGCGDLVLELHYRIARLEPGQVLKVIALDPGAPADMPAWCGAGSRDTRSCRLRLPCTSSAEKPKGAESWPTSSA